MSTFNRLGKVADILERSPLRAALAIFLLGLALRLLLIPVAHTWPDRVENLEVTSVAQSLALGEGFSNPFASYPTGVTAHVAPVYPYIVAALYKVFGFSTGNLIKQILACAITAAIYAMLPTLAALAGLSRHLGILAGFIGAVSIVSLDVDVAGRWEGHLATLLFVIAIVVWLRQFRSGSKLSPTQALLPGVVWGVLFLTSPSFIMVLAALCLAFLIRRWPDKRLIAYFATMALVSILVITPWTIRNYRTFGSLFFIRDNAGLEFYVSNAPESKITLAENVRAVFGELHPNLSKSAAETMADVGEVQFSRDYMQRFKHSVRTNPGRFIEYTVARALWMWFPVTRHPIRDNVLVRDIISCAIGLLSLVGLILLPRKTDPGPLTLIVAFFSYQFVYWFVQAATRYRFPLGWIFYLFCAYALLRLYDALRQKHYGRLSFRA